MVYIEAGCCHRSEPSPKLTVKPFPISAPPSPSLNGNVPTQLLPTVKGKVFGKAEVAPLDPEPEPGPRRHRKDDDDDGTDMKDIFLGGLIGAALSIFVVGLLLVLLIG